MQKSLYDKMQGMHKLTFEIIDDDKWKELEKNLSDSIINNIYAIADGLTEEFILDRIRGRTSLQQIIYWTPEKIETLIDNNIKGLKEIKRKLLMLRKQGN